MKHITLVVGLLLVHSLSFGQALIPQDKAMHLGVGAVFGAAVYSKGFEYYYKKGVAHPHERAVALSFGSTLMLAAGKEMLDWRRHTLAGTWTGEVRRDSYADIVSTLIGSVSLVILLDDFNRR